MTIARKLYAMIAIAIVGMLLLAGVGTYQIDRVNTAASYSTINTVPSILELDRAVDAVYTIQLSLRKYISAPNPAVRQEAEKSMMAARASLDKAFATYEKEDLTDATDADLLKEVRKRVAAYEDLRTKLIAQALTDQAAALAGLESSQPVADAMMSALEEHKKYNVKLGQTAAQTASDTKNQATAVALIISALMAVVIGCIGVLLARNIGNSLRMAVSTAEAVAQGDLTLRISTASNDEIGQLQRALGSMVSNLSNVVTEVRASVNTIAVASGEIAAGNIDLSSRTEQQAGSLEETASAMEELTSTVKQNADNARQANQMADAASHVATEGGQVVGHVVTTMVDINEASRKIVDIISVIDGIAFQTNILALNAAVEAARAGEQGRGFAVVASEVRTLAQRSAAAAKEIKELIDNTVAKVDEGSRLVEQAGSTMEQVVSSVKRVTDVVSEITAASSEQSDGIGQVNQAITLMDEATQQNAALVEEAAAASKSLQDQADRLAGAVAFFRVESADRGPIEPSRNTSAKPRAMEAGKAPAGPAHREPKERMIAPSPSPKAKPKMSETPALGSVKTEKATKEGAADWEEF
ncbi:methyl-accepting chemotaxis protein [Herbaspirillum sp. C7C8]|uniref:methyl-accepting chemotaxis protein n=1 Tax=Herbaspirillum sp. C7C8 TaxID=2736665 RepID=UPI001F52821A|nr:methyl-accepting chemotaxis protein [Herbaspirillum sp. C7C8]MCI1003421.1 MCP four helix bundle domain-containing protein [Herbaspirillum sp. C7C8]